MSGPHRLLHVPNFVTALNLMCGSLSIISSVENQLHIAAYFILAGALFDFLDGFLAKQLNAYTDIGKQLDSLADIVSFGVAPFVIVYQLMDSPDPGFSLWIYTPVLIAVFAGIRLAIFNTDTSQKSTFRGLPVPANALFFASLPLILRENLSQDVSQIISSRAFLMISSITFSFFMVSKIRMFSLKFDHFKFKENEIRYLFILFSGILLILLHGIGLAMIILSYILISYLISITSTKSS